jgi:hypothetical protein
MKLATKANLYKYEVMDQVLILTAQKYTQHILGYTHGNRRNVGHPKNEDHI